METRVEVLQNPQMDQQLIRHPASSRMPRDLEASAAAGNTYWPSAHSAQQGQDTLLMEYYKTLVRHRLAILIFASVGALAGLMSTVATLPLYRAKTTLDIQRLNSDFMNMREVATTGQGENNSSDESYVQTQIKLLLSDTLRARTVARLQHENAGIPVERLDTLSQVERFLHMPTGRPLPPRALLEQTAKSVAVKAVGVTRLVEVTCDSWDPAFAAAFCNTLTKEFAEQDREVRFNEAQKTSQWLSGQLADVRQSVAESEKKLEGAAGDDGLYQGASQGTVAEERLRELQAELMRAQADRVAKQAQYTISTSATADTLPVVLESAPLRDSQMKLEDLQRQVAALVPPLTAANPRVQHLNAQIDELKRSISADTARVLTGLKTEYDAARHREMLLQDAYSAQEQRVTSGLGKQAQISMLRREVDSGQQLYATLLQRVKEAGFASAMQASTVRVVDPAASPKIPFSPRTRVAAIAGCLVGGFLGIGFSFFRDRTQTILRMPGETPRLLHLLELGVIPSAKKGLRTARIAAALEEPAMLSGFSQSDSGAELTRSGGYQVGVWRDYASLVAEAYRNVTYSILLAGKNQPGPKVYVVSSPNVADGKTTVVCNLGLALAEANVRVLLIDGDIRKPRLHRLLGVSNQVGLRDWLGGGCGSDAEAARSICRQTEVSNLSVITSGTGADEPTSLLHSKNFTNLVELVQKEFDIILIDSPPMLHMADARMLAGASSGVILVFRSRVTDRETAIKARDLFWQDGVPVIGTILNDFDPWREGETRYYQTYYDYKSQEGVATS